MQESWGELMVRSSRSFIRPASFNLVLEWTVVGGAQKGKKWYSLSHPFPLLLVDCRLPTCYKFHSPKPFAAVKIKTWLFTKMILSTSLTVKLIPLCRLEARVSQGRSMFPCTLPKLSYVAMFPHCFLICSPFNTFACHLSPSSIPSRKKERHQKQNQWQ